MFTLAVRLATIEEVTRPKQNGVSQAFSDTLKNLEDDLKNDKSGNVADIKNKISQKINKNVVPDWKVDSSIIGGLIFDIDELIIDNSVRHKLEDLSKHIIKE